MPLTVCVDFDGTICHYAFPECGEPRREVVDALQALREEGWHIMVHSARVNSSWREPERTDRCREMLAYLLDHGIPFDSIWGVAMWPYHDSPGLRIGSEPVHHLAPTQKHEGCAWAFRSYGAGKPAAHVYLDDRAVVPSPGLSSTDLCAQCRQMAQRANDQYKDS